MERDNQQLPPVAIIAGGKGTRLGLKDLPKPMAPINGKPLLQYHLESLSAQGFKKVYVLAGHMAEKIVEAFGDGSGYGLEIEYLIEDVPLGTAGAVLQLKDRINEDFMVIYGDVYVDMDYKALLRFHRQRPNGGTLVVHPNDHPYDSDLVAVDAQWNVTQFHSKPHPDGFEYRNLVNAALYVLTPSVFSYIPSDHSSDFGKHIFPAMVAGGETLRAYSTPEYLKDMGTPDRLEKVGAAIASGKAAARNKAHRQRAIFFDRDGVINKEVDGVKRPEQMELLPTIAQALKQVNESNYLAIVVTNQPFIAKGMMSYEDLEAVHRRLETLLGTERCFIDGLYFCPHHPEKGWEGEVPELKVDCQCRKPSPGMLLQAADDFNIDLSKSYIIGDRTSDMAAGVAAGLAGGFLLGQEEHSWAESVPDAAEAVTRILRSST